MIDALSFAWFTYFLTVYIVYLFNPIPHGMCRAHNFMGGGHIDPTTFEALWGPSYAPLQ